MYLFYVEQPPSHIMQNIKRDIFNFLWDFRKIRVNMTTAAMPISEGGLGILDIEVQCKAIKSALIAKLIKDAPKQWAWIELMLYHLNMFRDAQQGLEVP